VSASAADFASGDYSQIFEWVGQLLNGPEGRDKALSELSKKREQYDDLALILWHSFGTQPPYLCSYLL
jgi:CCR4-NOT transcription complex subunit 9